MYTFLQILELPFIYMVIVMAILKFFPPKYVNAWYGYRTPASMKNEARWAYAQRLSADLFLLTNVPLLFIQIGLIAALGSQIYVKWALLAAWIIWIISCGVLILIVEKRLKPMP